MLNKLKWVSFVIGVSSVLILNGCAKMIDGTIDGIAYTTHLATGIDVPKKENSTIYIEANNDYVYNKNECSIVPDLKKMLTAHDWKIVNTKDKADYEVEVVTLNCGFKTSTRTYIPNNFYPLEYRTTEYKNLNNTYKKGTTEFTSAQMIGSSARLASTPGGGKAGAVGIGLGVASLLFDNSKRVANFLINSKIKVYDSENKKTKSYDSDITIYRSDYSDYNKIKNTIDYKVNTFASGIFYR